MSICIHSTLGCSVRESLSYLRAGSIKCQHILVWDCLVDSYTFLQDIGTFKSARPNNINHCLVCWSVLRALLRKLSPVSTFWVEFSLADFVCVGHLSTLMVNVSCGQKDVTFMERCRRLPPDWVGINLSSPKSARARVHACRLKVIRTTHCSLYSLYSRIQLLVHLKMHVCGM